MRNLYLERYAHPHSYLDEVPPDDLRSIVVIPCCREPELVRSLESLRQCHPTQKAVKIIVVVNQAEDCDDQTHAVNERGYHETTRWRNEHASSRFSVDIIWVQNMSAGDAGVGLARKIGMDEAVRQFEKLKGICPAIHNEGVIVCFDADCLCDVNYLQTIERYFSDHREAPAAVVYYEHPLSGDLQPDIYRGIAQYELFLRYHVRAQRYAGYFFARQTVGPCIAVRSAVYQKAGGMNKRKAGEDFYFLQKLFPMPHFGEINQTRVIPSPRLSDRVPFGTGRTMTEWMKNRKETLEGYHIQCYEDLRTLLSRKELFFKANDTAIRNLLQSMPQSVARFAEHIKFPEKLAEINDQSPSIATFDKRFFQWFNGFRILKFIHFARDNYYPNIPVNTAAQKLLQKRDSGSDQPDEAVELLTIYRRLDRYES